MTGRFRRIAAVVLSVAAAVAACTPSTGQDSTTTRPSEVTTSTTVPLRTQPLPGPRQDRAAAVASAFLVEAGDYVETDAEGVWELDAVEAITRWFPDSELSESAFTVFENGDARVVVVSLIPIMFWRGDPTFVPALATPDIRSEPSEIASGVYRLTLAGGLVIDLWSTGDGLLVAASLDEESQTDYLSLREAARGPLAVWASGTCLDLPDEFGLPWAPFPSDAVVECDEPHNAEVIHSEQVGTQAPAYDEAAIASQRSYDCDRAYEDWFGPQRDHRPSLITYMPDEDEWNRGDRYLACVVQLNESNGTTTMSTPMADRNDLAWAPEIGECFAVFGDTGAVPCDAAHAYELVGTIDYASDAWPDEPATELSSTCAPFLDQLAPGPGTIEAVASGLYPFAFEAGQREIRCFAVAVTDDGIANVIGSFTGSWIVVGSGGIPA